MEDLLPVVITVIFCISCLLRILIEKRVENGDQREKTLKDIYNILIIVQCVCVCFFGFKLIDIIS
jgi:hypothetical protein